MGQNWRSDGGLRVRLVVGIGRNRKPGTIEDDTARVVACANERTKTSTNSYIFNREGRAKCLVE